MDPRTIGPRTTGPKYSRTQGLLGRARKETTKLKEAEAEAAITWVEAEAVEYKTVEAEAEAVDFKNLEAEAEAEAVGF